MKPLPLPVRVAAGLAIVAVDRARQLPEKLAELPVTVVSQALQFSMRVQQQVTELAIKGDDALASFRQVEETAEWATFDEDTADQSDPSPDLPAQRTPTRSRFDRVVDLADHRGDTDDQINGTDVDDRVNGSYPAAETPASRERTAVTTGETETTSAERTGAEKTGTTSARTTPANTAKPADDAKQTPTGPTVLPNYPDLSLPQLRARLRKLTIPELQKLVNYERRHQNRPEFVGMLTRRITTLRAER